MFKKIKLYVSSHKKLSIFVVVLLLFGAYWTYAKTGATTTITKYVVQTAAPQTVIASVSASGQVQAGTQIDVKPQTSENVTKILVHVGDHVAQGQLLVQLDTTNEQKSLTQAQLNMQSAQLALAKLEEAPSTSTLVGDEDSVTQAEESFVKASTSLVTDYQSGFDGLAGTFVDFQNVMTGLNDFIGGNEVSKSQSNPDAYINLLPGYLVEAALPYRNDVQSTYAAAVSAYHQNLIDYQAATRNSLPTALDALSSETYDTATAISDAVKAAKTLMNYVVDNYPSASTTSPLPPVTNTFQTSLGNYGNTMSNDVTNIGNAINTISSDKTAINDDMLSLQEKQDSLVELQAGPDSLDLQSQQLSIAQQQISLQDAETQLADDSLRAPIAGIVSAIGAVVGTPVSSSAVTLVGDGEVAEVTLNELDAAKVSLGNQATLTFDALPNLSIAGQIVELDPVGTVSQGVVNYNVQIGFTNTSTSTQAIKPGMSVTANIVTQADQNVIAVPNAAVHTSAGSSYVLEPASSLSADDLAASAQGGILLPAGTKMVPVTTSLSNDTLTEITSGVNAGDQIIVQTIKTGASTAAGTTSGGTSALRALGGGGNAVFGGGAGGGFGGGTTRGGATTGR